jgi:tagatose 6-phosphate kinase
MIYAVTLNPTVDRTLTVECFRVGSTRKATQSVVLPAGKGINAARVIATLDQPVAALGLVGDRDQASFDMALAEAGIENMLTVVPGATRNSVTILDPADESETHLREPGGTPPEWALGKVEQRLRAISAGDWVLLAGSLPAGLPEDTYLKLGRLVAARGAHTLLDSSGPALLAGVDAPPTLLKPNLFELGQLDRRGPGPDQVPDVRRWSIDEVLAAARRIRERGVEVVVVSRGEQGVVALDREARGWHGVVDLDRPVVDAVGSGDALAGGLLVGLQRGMPFADTLRLGIACGAANVLLAGAGRCYREDIDRLARRARVALLG